MEIIYTKDKDWMDKWDAFIINNDRGSHLLLSDWIKSYQSYGFDYEFCICVDNNDIIGGYGAVIAKALFFKFFIVPYGPILAKGYESSFNELIATVPDRAKYYNSCYCHITLPFSNVINKHLYNFLPELSVLDNAKEGHLFKYVYSSNGLNWIDLKRFSDEEFILENFRASVRRYVRSSLRKNLEARFLENEEEIKLGYELCLENASNNNYSLRDWMSFKDTLIEMIFNQNAKFIGAFKEGNLKGAALILESGNYSTYILGGTKKEKPDLLVGHFLHWTAIKYSFSKNLSGYNISLGGSKGVVDFKNSYADEQIIFEKSKYHWILKPSFFYLFVFFEKHMKPHKKHVSLILSMLKKKNDK